MIVKNNYKFFFESEEELVVCKEDVFYEDNRGKIYYLYNKGQLISKDVFNSIFKEEKVKIEEVKEQIDEPVVVEPTIEEIKEEVVEPKEEAKDLPDTKDDSKKEKKKNKKDK